MSGLERLGKSLSRFVNDVRPSLQIFLSIDAQGISEDLDLVKKGEKRGRANQPPQNADTYDSVENEIFTKLSDLRRQGLQTFQDEMRVYSDRIRALSIEQRVTEISLATKEAIAEFRSRVHTGNDDLYTLARAVHETEKEVADFKDEHGLRRTPHLPESHILHFGVIAFMLVVEGALNGNFLAQGLSGGVIAGVLSALVIALLNIGFGFLLGYYSRNLCHKNSAFKLSGIASIISQVAFVLLFNLFVAHYRDALATSDPEGAVRVAVVLFKENPLGLQDFNSWILAGMGILFSWFAFIDGFKWDDPYPGYGATSRKNQKAHDYYNVAKQDLIEELADIKDVTSRAMALALDDMTKRKREYFDVIENQKRLCGAFNEYVDHVEAIQNHLLAIYRDANNMTREKPAPKYFSKNPKIQRPSNIKPDEPPYTSQQINALMKKADQAISRSADQLNEEHESAFLGFKDVNSIVKGGSDGSPKEA